MPGQGVGRMLDALGMAERSRRTAQCGEISPAEWIAFEAAMDIGAGNAAIARHRAIRNRADHGEGAGAVLAAGPAQMDLVAVHGGPGRDMNGADALQRLVRLERRLDIEEAKAVDRFRLALETLPVMNPPTQHLVAAAQPEHPAAAPQMGADVRIPPLFAQEAQ